MSVFLFLWRNMKWRFHNAFTIVVTILQPMMWLVLYGAVAGQTMSGKGIPNYTAFILPGLIVLVSFGCCSSTGIMNYLMKMDGSFYRILIAPVRQSAMISGQLLEAVLCAFLEVGIMLLAGIFFSVRIAAGPSGIFFIVLLVFLTAFFISGLAYAISLTLPNEVVYETVMNALVLPVFFLSSALFPSGALTGALGVVVNLNPFTHVIDNLRALILQGSVETPALGRTLFMLSVMCGLSFWWAHHRLLRETSL